MSLECIRSGLLGLVRGLLRDLKGRARLRMAFSPIYVMLLYIKRHACRCVPPSASSAAELAPAPAETLRRAGYARCASHSLLAQGGASLRTGRACSVHRSRKDRSKSPQGRRGSSTAFVMSLLRRHADTVARHLLSACDTDTDCRLCSNMNLSWPLAMLWLFNPCCRDHVGAAYRTLR